MHTASLWQRLLCLGLVWLTTGRLYGQDGAWAQPFGAEWPRLDSDAVGEWWQPAPIPRGPKKGQLQEPLLLVPRDEVLAFALYTHDHGVLKLTAQLYPLLPHEPREVQLELERNGQWQQVAAARVVYPGWSAHFRIVGWDNTQDVRYRVLLGQQSRFEGLIRQIGRAHV